METNNFKQQPIPEIYQILMIEDDDDDIFIIKSMLTDTVDFRFNLDTSTKLEDALEKMKKSVFDIILMDLNLPDSHGLETLKKILNADETVPIVVLTGLNDKTLGILAVKEGAQDYLVKGEISGNLLARVISYSVERKKTEEMIKSSLKEKEILLKEIHHRVKNNLQVISSLLNLQSRYILDNQDLMMFKESQNRIRTIAMIHEKLYHTDDFNHINFSEYIESLASDLFNTYKIERDKVTLKISVKELVFGIDRAVPCGLIINELLSNALKYAFPESFSENPEISITYTKINNNEGDLVFQDNGAGLPKDFDPHKSETLGMFLVVILAEEQLGGKIFLENKNGTCYRIRIPIKNQ
ncbi:MAG: response regulator [Spirochaetales bacterium]|nr:response regulator [Spirochaetales bacterium]